MSYKNLHFVRETSGYMYMLSRSLCAILKSRIFVRENLADIDSGQMKYAGRIIWCKVFCY